jgi:hypothetical protein
MNENVKTQKDKVLQYILRNGSITSLECAIHLRIMDLQGVIRDLKKVGYNIQDKWMQSEDGNKYKVYWIEYK